jgi:hypothetical protein
MSSFPISVLSSLSVSLGKHFLLVHASGVVKEVSYSQGETG